jgi:phosphoglucosamine mutase
VPGGRTLSEAASVLRRYPQATRNVPVSRRELPQSVLDEAARLGEELGDRGRVLVRPSGTEPLVRVLVEAETAEVAGEICARIARLVGRELG